MKNCTFSLLLFSWFLMGYTPAKAQPWTSKSETRNRHHVYAAGKGGVNSFLYRYEGDAARPKLGGSIGLYYDFYFLKFMGIGSGIEFSFFRNDYKMPEQNYQIASYDSDPMSGGEGTPFTFCVEATNGAVTQSASYMYIPLMLRFRFHHFYMGIGAKAGIFLGGQYQRNLASLKTYGIYENLPDPIENIPEHGFITESAVGSSGNYKLKTDWALAFDFGVNLHPNSKKNRYQTVYFGLYVDYGLRNLYKGDADTDPSPYLVVYNSEAKNCLQYNIPANISSQALNIHSLSVGLKMAVGLSLK